MHSYVEITVNLVVLCSVCYAMQTRFMSLTSMKSCNAKLQIKTSRKAYRKVL